jgi:hypothetical protein
LEPLGRDYFQRYITTNPHIYKIKQKSKDIDRIVAQQIEEISKFFEVFLETIIKYGVQPSDMWNFDETGFRIGIGGNVQVGSVRSVFFP